MSGIQLWFFVLHIFAFDGICLDLRYQHTELVKMKIRHMNAIFKKLMKMFSTTISAILDIDLHGFTLPLFLSLFLSLLSIV